jgi:hypothetical protein
LVGAVILDLEERLIAMLGFNELGDLDKNVRAIFLWIRGSLVPLEGFWWGLVFHKKGEV